MQAGRQHRTECGEPHEGSTDLTASASELQTIKARHVRERAALRAKGVGVEVLSGRTAVGAVQDTVDVVC